MRRPAKQKPVYAFIDSQNLNQSIKRLGWKMDWHKFRQFLTDKYGVTHAYMFIGYVPEFEAMYQQLHETGYLIVLKPTYDMTRPRPEDKPETNDKGEEEDKKPTKGNIDADLVLWAMKELNNYSKAVIVSGDGDFYSLVEYLDEQKKLLKLLAPSMYYSNLYNRYEQYVERLDLHRKELAYWDTKNERKGLMVNQNLEERLAIVEKRNIKVEQDKAWETSWTRKLSIGLLTYMIVTSFLIIIHKDQPFINALVPVIGYLLSTLVLRRVRLVWQRGYISHRK